MIEEWISARALDILSQGTAAFSKGKPFPHLLIKHFLIEKQANVMARSLRACVFERKDADLFSFSQTADLTDYSSTSIRDFVSMLTSREFSTAMGALSALSLKPGALDLSGSLYVSGDYLLCHDDRVEDRKLAYILYLSEDFSASDGGAFALFDSKKGKPNKIVQRYYPTFNSLLVFEVSPLSFHAVEEVLSGKKRYAIGGWLH